MREAAASSRLEAKSDLIVNANRRDGRGSVGRYNHSQSIRERRALHRDIQRTQVLPPEDRFHALCTLDSLSSGFGDKTRAASIESTKYASLNSRGKLRNASR